MDNRKHTLMENIFKHRSIFMMKLYIYPTNQTHGTSLDTLSYNESTLGICSPNIQICIHKWLWEYFAAKSRYLWLRNWAIPWVQSPCWLRLKYNKAPVLDLSVKEIPDFAKYPIYLFDDIYIRQISCDGTCHIWTWYSIASQYFENFK